MTAFNMEPLNVERRRVAALQAALRDARMEINNPGANRASGKDILEIIEAALQG